MSKDRHPSRRSRDPEPGGAPGVEGDDTGPSLAWLARQATWLRDVIERVTFADGYHPVVKLTIIVLVGLLAVTWIWFLTHVAAFAVVALACAHL